MPRSRQPYNRSREQTSREDHSANPTIISIKNVIQKFQSQTKKYQNDTIFAQGNMLFKFLENDLKGELAAGNYPVAERWKNYFYLFSDYVADFINPHNGLSTKKCKRESIRNFADLLCQESWDPTSSANYLASVDQKFYKNNSKFGPLFSTIKQMADILFLLTVAEVKSKQELLGNNHFPIFQSLIETMVTDAVEKNYTEFTNLVKTKRRPSYRFSSLVKLLILLTFKYKIQCWFMDSKTQKIVSQNKNFNFSKKFLSESFKEIFDQADWDLLPLCLKLLLLELEICDISLSNLDNLPTSWTPFVPKSISNRLEIKNPEDTPETTELPKIDHIFTEEITKKHFLDCYNIMPNLILNSLQNSQKINLTFFNLIYHGLKNSNNQLRNYSSARNYLYFCEILLEQLSIDDQQDQQNSLKKLSNHILVEILELALKCLNCRLSKIGADNEGPDLEEPNNDQIYENTGISLVLEEKSVNDATEESYRESDDDDNISSSSSYNQPKTTKNGIQNTKRQNSFKTRDTLQEQMEQMFCQIENVINNKTKICQSNSSKSGKNPEPKNQNNDEIKKSAIHIIKKLIPVIEPRILVELFLAIVQKSTEPQKNYFPEFPVQFKGYFPYYVIVKSIVNEMVNLKESKDKSIDKYGEFSRQFPAIFKFLKNRSITLPEKAKINENSYQNCYPNKKYCLPNRNYVNLTKMLFSVNSVPIIIEMWNLLSDLREIKTQEEIEFTIDVMASLVHNDYAVQLVFAIPRLFNFITDELLKKCVNNHLIQEETNQIKLELGCLILLQDFPINDSRYDAIKISNIIASKLENFNQLHVFGHFSIEWLMSYPEKLFTRRILIALCKIMVYEETDFGSHGLILASYDSVKFYLTNLVDQSQDYHNHYGQNKNFHEISIIARMCFNVLLQHRNKHLREIGEQLISIIPIDQLFHVNQISQGNQTYNLQTMTIQNSLGYFDKSNQSYGPRINEEYSSLKTYDTGFKLSMSHIIGNNVTFGDMNENIYWNLHRQFDREVGPISERYQYLLANQTQNEFEENVNPLKLVSPESNENEQNLLFHQETTLSNNQAWINWKILWENSRYIIFNKMKTSFGKSAKDTLMAIEKVIKIYESNIDGQVLKYSSYLISWREHLNNELFEEDDQELKLENRRDEIKYRVERPQIILQLIENLEKLMYGYYGSYLNSTINIPNPRQFPEIEAVRQFFISNEKVCQTWFRNIRKACIRVALHCGKAASAVYHCNRFFEDFEKNPKKSKTAPTKDDKPVNLAISIDKYMNWHLTILMCTEGLIQLKNCYQIKSLREYAMSRDDNNNSKLRFNWLEGAENQANSYFEKAITIYKNEIKNLKDPQIQKFLTNFDVELQINFIVQLLATCYSNLGNAGELKKLCAKYRFLNSIDELNNSYNQAIERYTEGNYREAADLAKNAIGEILQQELNSTNKQDKTLRNLSLKQLKTWRWPRIKTVLSATNLLVQSSASNQNNLEERQELQDNINFCANYSQMLTTSVINQNATFLPASIGLDYLMINRYKTIYSGDQSANFGPYGKSNGEHFLKMNINSTDNNKFDSSNSILSWAKLDRAINYESSQVKDQEQFNKTNLRLFKVNSQHISSAINSENYIYSGKVLLKSLDNVIYQSLQERNIVNLNNYQNPRELVAEFDNERFRHVFEKFLDINNETTRHLVKLQILCSELMHKYDVNGEDCKETAICCSISAAIRSFKITSDKELSGKAFLSTADWLQDNYRFLNHRTPRILEIFYQNRMFSNNPGHVPTDGLIENLNTALKLESEIYKMKNSQSISELPQYICNDTNMIIIGSLYHLATYKADKLGESWLKYANFCYNYSKQLNEDAIKNYVLQEINHHNQFTSGHVNPQNFNSESIRKQRNNYTYSLYREAVLAYEKYLSLGDKDTIGVIKATLRLMKMLSEKAEKDEVLQNLLTNCILKNTEVDVWTEILPQILAKLILLNKEENRENSKQDNFTLKVIKNLLQNVAAKSPELIIFPALERKHKFLIEIINQAKNGRKILSEVKLLISQLNKSAGLWNELWEEVFIRTKFEQNKALKTLQDEENRLKQNSQVTNVERNHMIREQIIVIMKPLLNAYQRVNNRVMKEKEDIVARSEEFSKHEEYFLENVQPALDKALRCLESPPLPKNVKHSLLTVRAIWSNFENVFEKMKRMNKTKIDARMVLPKLVEMKNTEIPLPGKSQGNSLRLSRVENTIYILPSKTKPKKITFLGNNGKKYDYLFKFQEDLHLDERIMQMLSVVNSILSQSPFEVGFKARYYAVTPLGKKSGLIEWVDHTLPMFELYKSHLAYLTMKDQEMANKKAEKEGNSSALPITVPPRKRVEIFTDKLKKFDINFDSPRRTWDSEKLLQVFNELVEDTPDDLLSREIWLSSCSSMVHFERTMSLSRSCAVASMVGYIIGLGDRHLDNVLVDMKTTEFVHIDYNVCFEKGLRFRIPEKIPFRLTQNMIKAIQFHLFKCASVKAIDILKLNSEAIMTLFDAFLHDPIFDWTLNVEEQQEIAARKREQEKATVARVLFSSRLAEIRYRWSENKQAAINKLTEIFELRRKMKINSDNQLLIANHFTDTRNFTMDPNPENQQKILVDSQIFIKIFHDFRQKTKTVVDLRNRMKRMIDKIDQVLDPFKKSDSSNYLNTQVLPKLTLKHTSTQDKIHNEYFQRTNNMHKIIREALINAGKEDLISKNKQAYNHLRQLNNSYKNRVKEIVRLIEIWANMTLGKDNDHRLKLWHQQLSGILEEFPKPELLTSTLNEEILTVDHIINPQKLIKNKNIEFIKPDNNICFKAIDMYESNLKAHQNKENNPDTLFDYKYASPAKYRAVITEAEKYQSNIREYKHKLEQNLLFKTPRWTKNFTDTFKNSNIGLKNYRFLIQKLLIKVQNLMRNGNLSNELQIYRSLKTQEMKNGFKFSEIFRNDVTKIKSMIDVVFYLLTNHCPNPNILNNFKNAIKNPIYTIGQISVVEILTRFNNSNFNFFSKFYANNNLEIKVEVESLDLVLDCLLKVLKESDEEFNFDQVLPVDFDQRKEMINLAQVCSKILLEQKLKIVMDDEITNDPGQVIIDLLEHHVLIENQLITHQELNVEFSRKYTEITEKLHKFQWENEEILEHFYQKLHFSTGSFGSSDSDKVSNQANLANNRSTEIRLLVNNSFIKPIERRSCIIEIFEKFLQNNYENKFEDAIQKVRNYESQIKSRLQWQGHNKELQAILPDQHNKVLLNLANIEVLLNKNKAIFEIVQSIVNYERFRKLDNSEGLKLDSEAYIVLSDCISFNSSLDGPASKSFSTFEILYGKYLSDLGPSFNSNNGQFYLQNYMNSLEQQLNKCQHQNNELLRIYQIEVTQAKGFIKNQAKLFDNVKDKLKNIQQIAQSQDQNSNSSQSENASIFENNNNNCAESNSQEQTFESIFRNLSVKMENFIVNEQEQANLEDISSWDRQLSDLYAKLEDLATERNEMVKTANINSADVTKNSAKITEGGTSLLAPISANNSVSNNTKTSSKNSPDVNIGNQQAIKVLNRIEEKLNKLNGQKTVDELVISAMDTDNLSQLYEGWTGWV